MVYVRVTARVEVQVSALSGLGAIGNYNQVATARILHNGALYEVPVITGNALKHWHAVYAVEAYQALGGNMLNELCKRGIGLRGFTVNSTLKNPKPVTDECEALKDFCNDLHGFFSPQEKKPVKRDSLVKISFAVPVLEEENLKAVAKFAVQHNRVVPPTVNVKQKEGEGMMLFKQEYGTGLYAFALRMDLAHIGNPLFDECNAEFQSDERKRRAKASVLALLPLLTGAGSKQARALPIVAVREVLVAVSEKPMPNLIHAVYPDYCETSIDTVGAYLNGIGNTAKFYYYGGRCNADKVGNKINFKKVGSLHELIDAVINDVQSWIR